VSARDKVVSGITCAESLLGSQTLDPTTKTAALMKERVVIEEDLLLLIVIHQMVESYSSCRPMVCFC
jgi:hypothetical protein